MSYNASRPSVIVYGPPGCGKTRSAQRLMAHFRLTKLVELDDQPVGYKAPRNGTLLLTTKQPSELKRYDLAVLSFYGVEGALP